MMTLRFVPGDPIASARPRVTRHGTYIPARCREYQELVRECAMLAAAERDSEWNAHANAYHLTVHFHRATARRADFDNLSKNICDALNKCVWADDSLVTR